MADPIHPRDEYHLLPLLLAASIVVLLAIAAAVLRETRPAGDAQVASLGLLQDAYKQVVPGRTSQAQLIQLGFDTRRFRARTLAGLGVQEYFMPRTAAAFDALDPAVRSCFDGLGRCKALVFPLASPDLGGFMAAEAAPGDGRMVFLLKGGRVTYKAVQGV